VSQFKVVITDFGAPDNDIEAAELQASGLDIELVRLNARSVEELFPTVADADALNPLPGDLSLRHWGRYDRPPGGQRTWHHGGQRARLLY